MTSNKRILFVGPTVYGKIYPIRGKKLEKVTGRDFFIITKSPEQNPKSNTEE